MSKKVHSLIMSTLLLIGTLTLAFKIQTVKADWTWTETIYIRTDGSIDPPTAPITTVDNVTYTLTDNIVVDILEDLIAIVVERNNIVVDGAGYTLQGSHWGNGINLSGRKNVTIKNIEIRQFIFGIYLSNSSDISIYNNNITHSEAIGLIVQSSSDNDVTTNNIKYNYIGIQLEEADNNRISGNQIVANGPAGGIFLFSSTSNSISGNNITNNGDGIRLVESDRNVIDNNKITSSGALGLTIEYSDENNISGNKITSNGMDGIWLDYSGFNTIFENTVSNNLYGIDLAYASNNTIYHNNFINNTNQVHIPYPSSNVWDNGYPSGGNYWSDYTDADLCSGPYQNETGRDGIWDHPYVIDENNQDNYPLARVDFSLVDVDGNEFSLSDYRGKVVLLDFFATWCHPSVEEISHLKILHEEIGESLVIISISPEDEEVLRDFRNEYGIEWTIAKDTAGVFGIYNVQFLPTLVIIEQHGYICYRHVGLTEANVLRSEIESLLPSKTLLGIGWGWMRINVNETVHGRAELYKIRDEQIELVITYEGSEYSRTWNVVFHGEHKYGERYLCYSRRWGFLIVGLHEHRRCRFWYAVGRGTIGFGFPRLGRLRLRPV